ncbi:MAG: hypothetical protein ABI068_09145, partial [Ktedonobacterales bacterium]
MWRQSYRRLQGEHGTDLERYHQGYRQLAGRVSRHAPGHARAAHDEPAAAPASAAPLPVELPPDEVATSFEPVARSLAPRTQLEHSSTALAPGWSPAWSPTSSVRRLAGAKPPRLWLAVLATLLIVAAVVSTLAAANRLMSFNAVSSNTLSKPLIISTLAKGQIRDPQGAAFSPDGRSIAVIGFQASCSFWWIDLSNCGHALVLYNTRTGAVQQSIPLETLIGYPLGPIIENGTMPHPGIAISGAIHVVVSFSSLGWSPDGNRVAIIYAVLTGAQHLAPDDEITSGLLVVDVAHNASFTIQGDTNFFATPAA